MVLVAMHWGTENLLEADDEQQRLAQLLADAGVDVVLGSHPHVIGPLAWVEGAGGNKTLVAYSLETSSPVTRRPMRKTSSKAC